MNSHEFNLLLKQKLKSIFSKTFLTYHVFILQLILQPDSKHFAFG